MYLFVVFGKGKFIFCAVFFFNLNLLQLQVASMRMDVSLIQKLVEKWMKLFCLFKKTTHTLKSVIEFYKSLTSEVKR